MPVNGIRLNAVTGGAGPPFILLHGWPETWWEWHHVMPLLAAHFSVVAIDLRGAGFSDCPPDGYDKATMARDAHEVMVALGHQRYAVCGHDIGGMVALPQATTYREAVTHLAVLDVPLPGWTGWEAPPRALAFRLPYEPGSARAPDPRSRVRLCFDVHGRAVSTITAPSIRPTSRFTPGRWRFPAARAAAWNGIAPRRRSCGGPRIQEATAHDTGAWPGRRPAVRGADGTDAARIRRQRHGRFDCTMRPLCRRRAAARRRGPL